MPFSVARDTITGLKSIPDLVTPEVQIAIFDFGVFISAVICDESSDIPDSCWSMDLAGADNQTLA